MSQNYKARTAAIGGKRNRDKINKTPRIFTAANKRKQDSHKP